MKPPYKLHPLCKLFPRMDGEQYDALVADIKKNGLREKVITYKGEILDGQNRLHACEAAEIDPRFEEFTGDDPIAFVMSRNLTRRHLEPGQRAMIAAELANMKHGGERGQSLNLDLDPKGKVSLEKAAEQLSVSRASAAAAKKVKKESPKLAKQVKSGKMSLHAATQKLKAKATGGSTEKPLARGGLAADALRAQAQREIAEATGRRPMDGAMAREARAKMDQVPIVSVGAALEKAVLAAPIGAEFGSEAIEILVARIEAAYLRDKAKLNAGMAPRFVVDWCVKIVKGEA